jgi:outer membrane cobalamin receptor
LAEEGIYSMQSIKIIIVTFFSVLIFSTAFSAQTDSTWSIHTTDLPESLSNIISINLDNVRFEKALNIVSEKGEIGFNYSRNFLPMDQIVSLKMKNIPVSEALMKILNDTKTGLILTDNGLIVLVPVSSSFCRITGTVVEEEKGTPLEGVNIVIRGTYLGGSTNTEGKFSIGKLVPGVYTLEVSMMGYQRKFIQNILISENAEIAINITLRQTSLSLGEIIVTPGQFSLMRKEPASKNALSSEDVRDFPQLGEDIFRAVQRLPGLSGSGDFSARFNVRGGEQDEVLVLLDGMELYDPFHLKDFNGSLSIIDYEIIRSVDMFTGAFSSEYGNAMSGVFNMKTSTPRFEKPKTSISLSLLNTRFLSEGNFNGGKGSWQAIARLGYIRYVLKTIGFADEFDPSYNDLFGKVQYSLNSKHLISAHVLRSYDHMFAKDSKYESLDATYGNTYGWLKWDGQFSSNLLVQTVFLTGRVSKDRSLEVLNTDYLLNFRSSEERGFNFYGLKQDYSFKISNSSIFKWGFDARYLSVDYDFYKMEKKREELSQNDVSKMQFTKNGDELRSYISYRFRLLNPLTAEIGLRYDYASWSNDKNISPRVNIAYDVGKKTVIRAGWGKFYQTQKIHQLHIIDDEKTFKPAALSKHIVVGLEQEFDSGSYIRLEAYQKWLSHIHPRYLNFVNMMDISPEKSDDRIKIEPERGEAKGVELYAYGKIRTRHSFWVNFAYSIVEDVVEGLKVPRNMDQRFTVNLDYNYRPNSTWAFNIAWHYHSGWPYTEGTLKYTFLPDGSFIVTPYAPGSLNGKRFPAYHRLDVRLRRYFYTSKGRISLFFEVYNLYNRKNIREYDYEYSNITREGYHVERTSNGWLPIMPVFGISWDF